MTLIILTRSPQRNVFSKEFFSNILKKLLNIRRGPDAVTASIFRGLNELHYTYLRDPKPEQIKLDDIILVNGSIKALEWAISAKKIKKFRKLITGPNLVVTPNDHNGIINSSEIDIILQPSDWVKNFYISINNLLANKIKVWPAGVAIPSYSKNKKKQILVYVKNELSGQQFQTIKDALSGRSYKFIYYGKFSQADYFKELDNSQVMLYLSYSESQGLALQEAWARNVPTLVWDRGIWQYKKYSWHASHISSPYLSDKCGLVFSNFSELSAVFAKFINSVGQYNPREYIKNELSDKRSMEKMLSIISVV